MQVKNEFAFSGNVSREPETKSYSYGDKTITYTSVFVACNHPRKKDTKALFYEVQFSDKFAAEIALKLVKGEKVFVKGEQHWDVGKQGNMFFKLVNASFMPGWLPPKKDDAPPPAAPPAAAVETDDLNF